MANKKVTITYNGSQILPQTELSNSNVIYNGNTLISDGVYTKTLNCANQVMASNIIVGTKTLNCNGQLMSSNVVINSENALISVGDKPTNLNPSATYTGSTITNGYTCPANVTMTGNDRGTNVGTYTATYTPNTGYCWSDMSTGSVTVILIIEYASLQFTANTANSTISIVKHNSPTAVNIQISTDYVNWSTFTPDSTTVTLSNVGDKIYFRGDNTSGFNRDATSYYQFVMTGSIAASGNIMSLIDNGACTTTSIPYKYCFWQLFKDCSSLTSAPKLPATTLKPYCYDGMFYGCSNLTATPELNASTLASYCYGSMFRDCTKLVKIPSVLPATNLASYCYFDMFNGCTSITTAPALPATQVSGGAYSFMFYGCTSLTTVPELPSTQISTESYRSMFNKCSSLQVSDAPSSGCNKAWVIPKNGTNTTYCGDMMDMFYKCAGSRSSDTVYLSKTQKTFYTQNTPV